MGQKCKCRLGARHPLFCGWHSPTLPHPHLRKARHSYGHLDPGQPGAEAAPLAPRAQGPVVLGHSRQGTARGGVASQHLLQLTQSAAFCPRDSRGSLAWNPTNPPQSPRKPQRQKSHPKWRSCPKTSANSCKRNTDTHTHPQRKTPTKEPTRSEV